MREKYGQSADVDTVGWPSVMPTDDNYPPFKEGEVYDEDDNNELEGDYNHMNYDAQDDMDIFLDIDHDKSIKILQESFSPINLTLYGHNYPAFGNDISNTYFGQDVKMFHEEGELFGGIHNVSWRSRYRIHIHDIGRNDQNEVGHSK